MVKRKQLSIRDIARESGASLTTVSLVLNRRDKRISSATRKRILDIAARHRYRPSRLAQGLQSQRSGLLAILVPELQHAFADPYFGELISAVHDHANAADYKILLEVAHPDFIARERHLELFDRAFVDGLLCMGVTSKDEYLAAFEDGTRPCVLVNNYLAGRRLNSVRCDYEQAGRLAGEHFIQLGHRRLGLIHGAPEVQTSWDLRRGFEAALEGSGVRLPHECTADGLYTEEGGAAAAIALMQRRPDLTAIMAGNDKMAIGALAGLKSVGRAVPRDVSVIGCDDIHAAAFTNPQLTTVHTPLYEVGQSACRRLLQLLDEEVEAAEQVHPVRLTVRESAGPPPTQTQGA